MPSPSGEPSSPEGGASSASLFGELGLERSLADCFVGVVVGLFGNVFSPFNDDRGEGDDFRRLGVPRLSGEDAGVENETRRFPLAGGIDEINQNNV